MEVRRFPPATNFCALPTAGTFAASIDGTVTTLNVAGANSLAADVAVTVADLSDLRVSPAWTNTTCAPSRPGQRCEVTVVSWG